MIGAKRISLPWANMLRQSLQDVKLKMDRRTYTRVLKVFEPLLNTAQAEEDRISEGFNEEQEEASRECDCCGTKLDAGSKRDSDGKEYCCDCLEHETEVK